MSKVVIENPIINSPFDEPTRHFRFSDEGITDEIGDENHIVAVGHLTPRFFMRRSQSSPTTAVSHPSHRPFFPQR